MNTKNYLLIFIAVLFSGITHLQGQNEGHYDEETNTYYLRARDGLDNVTVDGSMTFKCVASGFIPTSLDAGVCFSPKNEGEIIRITIEDIDLDGSSHYLNLYHGYKTIGYPLPSGFFSRIGANEKGNVYLSEDAAGKMTVAFHSTFQNKEQTGWTITVSSIVPREMEYITTDAFLESVSVNRGGRNQLLAGINIKTEGLANPLSLEYVSFDINGIPENAIEKVKIYTTASSSSFTTENLLYETAGNLSSVTAGLDYILNNGNNYFWLVADIHPDAVPGTFLPVQLTSLKVGEEEKEISVSPANPAVISNEIWMQSGHLSYTIGDNMYFYDDGGKDGKISGNFEGSLTFVPATPGKSIQVDFTKLALFNTSSTGNNDVFKFYNGHTVDDSRLITTLLKEAESVKSTAEDGAMTISLKSITGLPADGWEAVVSEFTPLQMEYTGTAVQALSSESLAAYSRDVPMLFFNIQAVNTLQPLELQAVGIRMPGASGTGALAGAKVYFLGKNPDFSTSRLVAEAVPAASECNIAGSHILDEGNNWFALAYDVASTALNEEIVSAEITHVQISGSNREITSGIVAERKIENKYKAVAGTYIYTVYDEWIYTDAKNPVYQTLYNTGTDNCIVTFLPGTEGSVVQMEFSEFDVYYSAASYGTKATFEIYNGSAATSGNLIWKLDSNEKSNTGPEGKIRSTAPDGGLTVRFNPNTNTSSYTGTGWQAVVKPFVDKDMEITSLLVFQENFSPAIIGGTKQEILGFEIKAEGTLNPASLTAVTLDLKNSAPLLSKVSVLCSGEEKDFSKAVEVGYITYPGNNEITITGNLPLEETSLYFWVAYDVKEEVQRNEVLDAALVSVKAGNTVYTPEDGDPEGQRLTDDMIILGWGDNGKVSVTKPISFYDDGGAAGDYSNDFDGTITFLPREGEKIRIKFDSFRTTSTHYMYIYSGTEVDEDKLLVRLSGTSALPAPVLSASEDGALTIRFVSGTYTQDTGWEAEVESYVEKNLFIKSVTTEKVGDNTILRGSEKTPVQKITVEIDGDFEELALNNVSFTVGNTDNTTAIKKAYLYYTGASSGYIDDNLFGKSEPASSFSFSSDKDIIITEAGKYYFWLSYDIDSQAAAGSRVGASLQNLTGNNELFAAIRETETVEKIIREGFKGEYIIGSSAGADYPTFASAVDAMSGGLEGAVVFRAEAGTYPENIYVRDIRGTSTTNTITFTSLSGNNDDVVITGAGPTVSGNTVEAIFIVDSTSHVIVEKLYLKPTSQNYANNVLVRNISRYFTLRDCILEASVITSGYSGINHFRMAALNEEGKNNDYVTVENNTITGGYIGLYVGGTSYVALTSEKGAVIRNNVLNDQTSKGIYVFDEQSALIENNTVNSAVTQKAGYWGIDIFRNRGDIIVRNNKVTITQNYYSYGIELRSGTAGTPEQPALVYNNAISITNSPNASTYGIELNSDCANIHLYYNTISISGAGGYAFGVAGTSGDFKNVVFRNNLVQNNTASPVFFFRNEGYYKEMTFSNNAYYLAGEIFTQNWADDFESWITNAGETGSFLEQARFLSETDLHLLEAGKLEAAMPVGFITTDADGKRRDAEHPTIGAYEYKTIVVEVPAMEEGYPRVRTIEHDKAVVTVKFDQTGKLYSLIQKADEEIPSPDVVFAAEALAITQSQELNMTFAGLEERTSYIAFFAMISALDEPSLLYATEPFTTPEQLFPLEMVLEDTWAVIDAGAAVNIYAEVKGGVYPYTYEWRNAKNEILSADSVLQVQPEVVSLYSLTVTDAANTAIRGRTTVIVNGKPVVAGFDDLYLSPESYWQGFDDSEESVFYSGSYSFSNTYIPDWMYWGGFAYSNITETDFNPAQYVTHQFRSVTGHGANNSQNYAVVFLSGSRSEIQVMHNKEEGDVIPGVYLTNAAYTYHSILNGDSYSGGPFEYGDFYKVIFKGTAADGTVSSLEYYLADFRSENEEEHYVLDEWKWVDLSPLGKVTKVTLSVTGSRNDPNWGLNTPAYLCMDNFGSPETPDPVEPEPLRVCLPEEWDRVEAGTSVSLYPVVEKGIYPYTYQWKDAKNTVLSTDSVLQVVPQHVQVYTLTVKDAGNTEVSLRTTVYVNGAAAVATFDDLFLEDESIWTGYGGQEESVFYSGSYAFKNTHDAVAGTWFGFAYSNLTAAAAGKLPLSALYPASGKGAAGSFNYAVVRPGESGAVVEAVNSMEDGVTIPGVYLANTADSYEYIADGGFTQGDFYKVIFKGTAADGATSSLEYYLADFRSENEEEHDVVDEWKWVDLSVLGELRTLTLTTESSQNITGYFCLDELGSTEPLNGIHTTKENPIQLNIYPVPAKDILTVETPVSRFTVKIYNTSGNLLMYREMNTFHKLDVSGLPSGMYILEAVSSEGKARKNFIKE